MVRSNYRAGLQFIRFAILAALATTANADVFNIEFQPIAAIDPFGMPFRTGALSTGTIVTDGICTVCSITQSLGVVTSAGIDSIVFGPLVSSLRLGDPPATYAEFGNFTFDVATDTLGGQFGDGVGDVTIRLGQGTYSFRAEGAVFEYGTFTVTPEVPEPASIFFLGTVAIGAGFARKRLAQRK